MKKEIFYKSIEWCLRKVRYLLLFPVVFLSLALFFLVILMAERMREATQVIIKDHDAFDVLVFLIDIVDFTLIAVIILLIIWWIYELFIRDMPVNDHMNAEKVLIHDIDELKQKLWKVVIVSLIVHVFKQALVLHVDDAFDLVMLSTVVVLMALSLYLIEKMSWSQTNHEQSDSEYKKS